VYVETPTNHIGLGRPQALVHKSGRRNGLWATIAIMVTTNFAQAQSEPLALGADIVVSECHEYSAAFGFTLRESWPGSDRTIAQRMFR